ncbi:hypothetical protein QYF36_021403 [Acer negundo]|nr:hypothetical protein QYF36_021403 [Acer negundo]
MQIPRWRNVFTLKNSLKLSSLSSRTAVAAEKSALSVASFHSTPTSFEKRKNKWNAQDAGRAQQPTKSYVRYQTRQKRADTKKALKDLLFSSGSSKHSFQPFQNDDPIWKFDGTKEWGAEADTKGQSKSSARQYGKNERKKMKRKNRRENISEYFDDREAKPSGFEYNKSKDWETVSEAEAESDDDDDELCADRTILGLPRRGHLTLEAVKKAFRSSALKWHPDKHQGHSQAMAEEKFKLCVNAYKSLCDALY